MIKKTIITLVVSLFVISGANAATTTFQNIGNNIKEANKAVLKNTVNSVIGESETQTNEVSAANKAKIDALKKQQQTESDKRQAAIKAKKAELQALKQERKDMNAQQKAARQAALQKQLDDMQAKDSSMKAEYNRRIDALKL